MKRDLGTMTASEFDVVVVGGGIFGVALAWEATSRGLSVALLERGDFAEGASANSFKMVHGGIRYLQHVDIPRIRESSQERSAFLRTAPHLVRPLPIAVPTYGRAIKGRAAMRTALAVYDLLTADRNRGIKDPINHIPRGKILNRDQCLELFPQLADDDLTGAAVFCDGQMYNPTRLALAFLRSAVEAGALAANYVEVTGFATDEGRVCGVNAIDRLSGETCRVRGRMVLNAAGGHSEGLLGSVPGLTLEPRPVFSRDACFVVPRRLTGDIALAVPARTKDPDAWLSRGPRHLFMVPWRDYTLVGVWHVVHDGDPDEFTVTDEELQGFIDEVNEALPELDLSLDDVSHWNAGLVLFGDNDPGSENLSYGKRSRIVDHRKTDGWPGLISVLGVRYTTARGVAARTIDLVLRHLELAARPSETDRRPVFGGEFESFDELLRQVGARQPVTVSRELALPLLRNHGARYGDVLRYADDDPSLIEPLPGSRTLAAEVVHAVREEMAIKLGDVVLRRTDLGSGGDPDPAAVDACAALMGAELGWDPGRIRSEIEDVRASVGRSRGVVSVKSGV